MAQTAHLFATPTARGSPCHRRIPLCPFCVVCVHGNELSHASSCAPSQCGIGLLSSLTEWRQHPPFHHLLADWTDHWMTTHFPLSPTGTQRDKRQFPARFLTRLTAPTSTYRTQHHSLPPVPARLRTRLHADTPCFSRLPNPSAWKVEGRKNKNRVHHCFCLSWRWLVPDGPCWACS